MGLYKKLCIVIYCLAISSIGSAKGRYTEITLPITEEKDVHFYAEKNNLIIFEFKNFSAKDLTPLEQYDQRLIKRILIENSGADSTILKIFLQDSSLKSFIYAYKNPARITIQIYDRNFKIEHDPITGIPLTGLGETTPHDHIQEKNQEDDEEHFPAPPERKKDSPKNGSPFKLINPSTQSSLEDIDVHELKQKIAKAPQGRGEAWKNFPFFIYPLQMATEKEAPHREQTEIASETSIAEYAFNLFSMGHEKQALIAFQYVLYKKPLIFTQNPLYLWALAEISLGQNNLTLAKDYYQTLNKNFPESPLKIYSLLRQFDLSYLSAYQTKNKEALSTLEKSLSTIPKSNSSEALSLTMIRKILVKNFHDFDLEQPAELSKQETQVFEENLAQLENKRTLFTSESFILKTMLAEKNPWQSNVISFANRYFKNYSPQKTLPFVENLEKDFDRKFLFVLKDLYNKKEYLELIKNYENISDYLKKIISHPESSWFIAESYRYTDKYEKALAFYKKSSQTEKRPEQFRSVFWRIICIQELVRTQKEQSDLMLKTFDENDQILDRLWTQLSDTEKSDLLKSEQNNFEQALLKSYRLKTPATLLLTSWENTLKKDEKTESNATKNPTPGKTVRILSKLSENFQHLGMADEKHRSLHLLETITPEQMKNDKEAISIWTSSLLAKAEEERKANNLSQAGLTYAIVARNSIDWDRKAEILYKSGLLLYKAGRTEEALKSLKEASQEKNNMSYANLARERLERLEKTTQ